MPVVRTVESEEPVRVAVIYEAGGEIRPAWFACPAVNGGDQVRIVQVSSQWEYNAGSARILVFDVWDGTESYQLKFDSKALAWTLGVTETG